MCAWCVTDQRDNTHWWSFTTLDFNEGLWFRYFPFDLHVKLPSIVVPEVTIAIMEEEW